MKSSNLYIVDSPLQLLNAIEAREHFQLQNNILVIFYYKNHTTKHKMQMKSLIKLSGFDHVYFIESKYSKYFDTLKVAKKLQKYHFNYVFSGHYATSPNVIAASVQKEHFYLLDDGTLTLKLHKTILNPDYTRKPSSFIKRMRYAIFGFSNEITDTINLFTMFNLKPYANQTYIKNEYNYLKNSYLCDAKLDDTIYLIGQNFIYCNELSKDTYNRMIQKIKTHYSVHKIVYLPHREESDADLKELIDEQFSIVHFNHPVELEFLINKRIPKMVLGFVSTALITLQQLFKESEFKAFNVVDKKYNTIFDERYAYLESMGIEVEVLDV